MNAKSQKIKYAVLGLSLGLIGTLFGMYLSSAINATPALMGAVAAIWCAVSAGIIGSNFSR